MKIEHLAIYAENLDLLRDFYTNYFNFECGPKYENPTKRFSSYFLHSKEGGARLELMHIPNLPMGGIANKSLGLAHIAISVGNKEQVDLLTEKLRSDGFNILSEPRTTGDGYYESVVADPEGNHVEITMNMTHIKNFIFDFGGVLLDWDPRYYYRTFFCDENEMEMFLSKICSPEWNAEQDRGRTFKEGVKLLQDQYPEYKEAIQMYYDQWDKMLKGDFPESVELLKQFKQCGYGIFGLTNWSAETIDRAYERFQFFNLFDGIVVSGEEKIIKPDSSIYRILLNRYNLKADECVFIDDNEANINAAKTLGLHTILFDNITNVRRQISELLN